MANTYLNARGIKLKRNILVEFRRDKGLTQEALGRAARISKMNVWRAENGKSVDASSAKAIAHVLKIDLSDLRESTNGKRKSA